MKFRITSLFLGLCLVASFAAAQEPVKHKIMLIEYGAQNRLVEVSPEGKLTWEHKVPSIAVIFQPLAEGHVLYAFGGSPTGVEEVNRDKKVVWSWISKCPQILGCERLANGNSLAAEQGPAQVVEVTPKGEVAGTVKLTTTEQGFHRQVRRIHRLANGNTLVAHEGEGVAREVNAEGKSVWEYGGIENIFEALRLANGNTLIGCGTQKRVIEVTPDGKIAWEFKASDAPELNLTWITSLQVLKNGNYVVCNFIRGAEGKGAHAFEVTKDKKVVWKFADHDMVKACTMVSVLEE